MIIYDHNLYSRLISYSCLGSELVSLLVELPNKSILVRTGEIKPNIRMQNSCMFPINESLLKVLKTELEIRKHESLFKLKVNSENLPHILAELLKCCPIPKR